MNIVYSIWYRVCSINKRRYYLGYHIPHTTYNILNIGFTLIELLVVVAILATVGIVSANMFFQTLKGSTKAELTKQVKQEGDYAISIMEKMIRNAKSVESNCLSTGVVGSSIMIKNPDQEITTFECTGSGDEAHIASSSATATVTRLTTNKVKVLSDCGQFVKCTQSGPSPPVVEVKFSLSQLGSPTRPEEQATVNFQTTVSLRNY